MNSISESFNIIWINQKGFILKLNGSSSKFAQNKHPILIHIRGYIFFCNEVHPIFYRSDKGNFRNSIEGQQLFLAYRTKKILNGNPSCFGKLAVDFPDKPIDFTFQNLVFQNFYSAWNHNLKKCHCSV